LIQTAKGYEQFWLLKHGDDLGDKFKKSSVKGKCEKDECLQQ
jgi:hypothetical protein